MITSNKDSFIIKKKATTSEILNNDSEREEIYQRIVELLIAAGYFRARLQNIEPFDKILGGIVWTLTGCFYDVDIEFKDEMNLSEKIKVSEKISASLKTVNCPYILHEVQLQGLDLPIIFQVLQWLVKKLLETRDERNDANRKNVLSYFNLNIVKSKPSQINTKTLTTINKAKYNYISTGRIFRPVNKQNFESNDPLKIYFTLIEYGLNKDVTFQKNLIELLKKKNLIEDKEKEQTRKKTVTAKDSQKDKEDTQSVQISNEEKKKLDEIINTNIIEISNKNLNFQRINTTVIEEIFSDNVDAIISEIEKFENVQDEGFDKIKLFLKENERLDNNKQNFINQIVEYESELHYMKKSKEEIENEITESNEEIQKLNITLEENKNNLEKLNQKIKSAKISEEKMTTIGDKIKQKEDLKQSIARLKKDCLEEKKLYDNQLDQLEKKTAKMSDSENTQIFEEIDRNYQSEYEKNLLKKKDLFEQNKLINLLTRKIQVFPSKLELIQYQKRFQELYDQINHISEKSRKILNEINSKEEVLKLLNQKQDIFTQLKEGYRQCKVKKDKENFKDTLVTLLQSLSDTITNTSTRIKQTNSSIENLQIKLNESQSYENRYMKLIKEYNREYNKLNK